MSGIRAKRKIKYNRVYVDKHKTGTDVNRPSFQKMIANSATGAFQYVIVYMIDKFARNRYYSTIYLYDDKIVIYFNVNGGKEMSYIGKDDTDAAIDGLLDNLPDAGAINQHGINTDARGRADGCSNSNTVALAVKRASRFVCHNYLGGFDYCSRYGYSLSLSA